MTLQETTDRLNEIYKHLKEGREYVLDNKHVVKLIKKGVTMSWISESSPSVYDSYPVTNSRLKETIS